VTATTASALSGGRGPAAGDPSTSSPRVLSAPLPKRPAALVVWLALALAAGCRKDGALVFHSAPVFLISVDTLRADHLPAYGYSGVETPNLDALRRDSILFGNAYSHVPLTLPSHASLWTGLLPPQNGVRDNIGYTLGTAPETVAGFLKRQGWATGGAVSSVVLSRSTGIGRGFDFYDDDVEPMEMNQSLGRVRRDGGETEVRLTRWLEKQPTRMVFGFLHLYEPHSPYDSPEPYRSRYPLAYDGAIARADEIVGTFVKFLKERDLYDRSILVFLSDHGEGLNDHGEEEHGVLLYREAIHVPLLLKLPRSRHGGETASAPVALTDVFPTIAGLLGLAPPPGLSGAPLTAFLGEKVPVRRLYSETLYPRLHLGWSDLASLVDDHWQYIEAPRPELYDVIADSGERRDLSSGLPASFRSMRAELARMPRPMQAPGSADPEQVKKLAALGYLSASSADPAGKNLPDPKDRVAVIEQVKAGFGHLQANRYAQAAAVFRELLAKDPQMTDVWQMLAIADTKLGRDNEALEALKKAARLSPANPQVLLALANFYLETGQYEEARKHLLLARDSGASNVHENLARIALEEKDLKTAESEAEAALREYPDRRMPRLVLGRVKKERGDLNGALAELEMAKGTGEKQNQVPLLNVNFLRGDVLARLGKAAEAEAAFREEIHAFPGSVPGWTGLALLYASQGRDLETRRALGALAEIKTPGALFAAARTYEVLGDRVSASRLRDEIRRLFPAARERKSESG
jgi:choline-sulfatase